MKWSHKIYSRLFTLDLTWNCRRLLEAKKFSRSPGQFKWVTREQDIAYPSRGSKNGIMRQVAELFRRPRTMLKILWFIGDYQFFQKSAGIKCFHDPVRKNLGPGKHVQQNFRLEKPPWKARMGNSRRKSVSFISKVTKFLIP